MKFSAKHSIEPLEARIAPARIIQTGYPNGLGVNDVDYTDTEAPFLDENGQVQQDAVQIAIDDAFFLDTEIENGAKISQKVGGGVLGVADTFFLRMSAGDSLQIYNTSNAFNEVLRVKSGNIIAFFVDKDGDNEVEEGELTGISLGKGASIVLRTSVEGDIVANLNELGTSSIADDELSMTDLISDKQTIKGIQVTGGAVGGAIIAGGAISNISVSGTVGSILAGNAADGKTFDFFPQVTGGDGTLTVSTLPGRAGPSINKVLVDGIGTPGSVDPFNGLMKAGGGGAGAKGGSITQVQVVEDADGMTIQGGAGGDNVAGKGGAGGAVSKIYISGFPDSTRETVTISAGVGGNSANSTGGAGGGLNNIFVGYRLFGSKALPTDDLLTDQIRLEGGLGGSGKVGGAGGGITNADVRVETSDDIGDEIAIVGGAGGASTVTGGKGGVGGSLKSIAARNQDLAATSLYSDTLIQAGAGGSAVPGSSGGAGGSATGVNLLGWQLKVLAGNGAEGKVGGKGGSLSNVVVEQNDEILAIGAQFDAGFGGNATAGAGGAGGSIKGINVTDSDLADFIINGGNAGDGGDAIGGKGGAGGTVANVTIRDNDVSNGATQTVLQPLTLRTGAGGDGTKGGGAGGKLTAFSLEASNVNVQIFGGEGGDASGAGAVGKGGVGGALETISVTTTASVGAVPAFVNVFAGAGGVGAGNNGAGGAGGDLRSVTASAEGVAILRAGNGGNGQVADPSTKGGASGRGGSVYVSQATANLANGEISAGDAGEFGGKGGAGGSILGKNAEIRSGVFAATSILIQAGDGANGGAGGNLKFLGYGSSTITFTPSPLGNISILAGDGSALGKVAGVGGSIQDVSGSLASQDPLEPTAIFETAFRAGDGGGSSTKGAAGGSVRDIIILGGGYAGALLTVQAGDAGDSASAKTGAKGGDVKLVTVSSVDLGSIFRSVAAGDGGDASNKGGAGGSVDGIYVEGIDIGSRTDVPFGFTQMGGIFAGKTGEAPNPGVNGKVVNIVAKGIAAIVAGRDDVPQPAEFVDNIILSGTNTLLAEKNVFVQSGPFRLQFDQTTATTETTAGDGATAEVQALDLGALASAGADLTFTFGADTTVVLPGNATAAQIEAALNALESIKATIPDNSGAVDVVDGPTAGTFVITFTALGNQSAITVNATSETGLLPANATAAQVQLALNALPTIAFAVGDPASNHVNVTSKGGSYQVTYNTNENQVAVLEGIEVFSANMTELTQGSIANTLATEVLPGDTLLTVTELLPGQQALTVVEISPGDVGALERQGFSVDALFAVPGAQVQFGFASAFTTVEQVAGNAVTRESQTLDITAIRADSRSTFTLSFGGATSAPIAFNATAAQIQAAVSAMLPVTQAGGVGVSVTGTTLTILFNQNGARAEFTGTVNSTTPLLDPTVTEVEYQNALNAMASVRFTAVDRVGGSVAVLPNANNSFFVDFNEEGNQQMLVLNGFAREVQEIDRDALIADQTADFTLSFSRNYPGVEFQSGGVGIRERQDIRLGPLLGDAASTFTISYNNRTTPVLPGNATAAQIQTAINGLGVGTVTVILNTSTGTVQITTTAFTNLPLLFSAEGTSRTAPLLATATDVEVQTALNGLSTVKGPANDESVTVVEQVDEDYEVTFSSNGQRNPIAVALISQEVQQVDITSILNETTGSFRLSFGGESTSEFLPGANPDEVETALNNLASIIAAGSVDVVAGALPGTYDVTFLGTGDREEIGIRAEVDEVQDVDFAPGKPLTVTFNKEFIATEVIAGDDLGVQEVQAITLGVIIGSSAQYTISYQGAFGTETTVPLAGTATEAEVQAAIEALPSIGLGGVTVALDDTTITITFATAGNAPTLFTANATQSTAELASDATALEVETALNALATVQATGVGGVGGTVSVVIGTGSNFSVRFNGGGDEEFIDATQEQALIGATVRQGNAVQKEIQSVSPTQKGQPTDVNYANANMIGFYYDHTELDANIFHFIQNGVRVDSTTHIFQPGDQPIDGLLYAKKLNQTRLTVTPEAYRVGTVFFDWTNI